MVRLRAYRAEDREACLRVLDSNVPEYFLASDRDLFAGFLDDKVQAEGLRYFVVEDDGGAVVACGGVRLQGATDARMCWGMVRRDLHRRGIGRVLLAARLVEGAKMGAKTSSLETIPSVADFYVKAGYALVATTKDHYAPGWDRVDYAITLDEPTLERLRASLP